MRATIIDKELPDGDETVDYTVNGPMCGLGYRDSRHPCIVALARRLKAQSRSDEEAVRRAFNYVVEHIPYRRDPDEYELVVAPIYTLGCEKPYPGYTPHGDCDCQSTALASLLWAMGYKPQFRVVAWRRRDFTHVNVHVQLPDGRTIPLDVVMKGAGWGREKPANYREKIYDCSEMTVRALADNVSSNRGTSTGGRSARGLSGCGCAACRARGLSDCGCAARRRADAGRSCCPRNATSNGNSPVTVNVNTGKIDTRRWVNERLDVDTDASRWVQYPTHTTERQVITREVPRSLRVALPAPVVQPVIRERRVQPIMLRAQSDPPMRTWKEFT